MAPVRPCVKRLPDGRGCPNYTSTSRCLDHEREFEAERKANGATGRRGTSSEWAKARARALKRDRHRCTNRLCRRRDKLHVHHKNCNPDDNRLENLVTLCEDCHKAEHDAIRKLSPL